MEKLVFAIVFCRAVLGYNRPNLCVELLRRFRIIDTHLYIRAPLAFGNSTVLFVHVFTFQERTSQKGKVLKQARRDKFCATRLLNVVRKHYVNFTSGRQNIATFHSGYVKVFWSYNLRLCVAIKI